MRIVTLYSILLLLLISGCKSRKYIFRDTHDLPGSTSLLEEKLAERNLRDTTVILKNIKIRYSSDQNTTTLYGAIKMIKDTVMIVSLRAPLGIEMARILMRPHEIQILNRQRNTHMVTGYHFLKNQYHLDVNFKLLYQILLGNFPEDYQYFKTPKPKLYKRDEQKGIYVGHYYPVSNHPYKLIAWIEGGIFKPRLLTFYEKRNISKFDILFKEYIPAADSYIPEKIQIKGGDEAQSYTIDILYRDIELSPDKQVNFHVPSKFKTLHVR